MTSWEAEEFDIPRRIGTGGPEYLRARSRGSRGRLDAVSSSGGHGIREHLDLATRVDYIAKIETGGEIPNPDFICLVAESLSQDPETLLRIAKETRLARLEREIDHRQVAALSRRIEASTKLQRKERRMAKTVSLIN